MKQEILSKKEVVHDFLKKGILLSPDIIGTLDKQKIQSISNLIPQNSQSDILILNKDIQELLDDPQINWRELEKTKTLDEKGKSNLKYIKALNSLHPKKQEHTKTPSDKINVKVISSYNKSASKRDIQDFVLYFNHRYRFLESLLKNRRELTNTISINRIKQKKEREHISIIGIVKSKQTTKNNNIILTLEDPTNKIKVLINKNRPDLFKVAQDTVLDEVIAINGTNGDNIIFTEKIILPDVPSNRELKKSPDEEYAVFLSDIHVGSNNFLEKDFNKFLNWINCKTGNSNQREIASKVKYVFIAGDLVDGCGVYPGQDKELIIKDIYSQYNKCAKLLYQIPHNINKIICPGNHDAMSIAEPQPALYKEYASEIYNIPNTTLVSNPAIINIASTKEFPGFDVLLYHGYSFDYFISEVDSIRNNGGYDRADLIMKFLLKRRHLAPTHTSTQYIPDSLTDPLTIKIVPDIFVSGHIHKSIVAHYLNITLICGSCWQSKTTFQEKVGHNPEPSRVPIINLKTRKVKILKFSS